MTIFSSFFEQLYYFCVFQSNRLLQMKYFLSVFLVINMIVSVAVPLVVQLQGEEIYQLLEDNSDDTSDDLKVEKEKEIYTYNSHIHLDFSDNFSVSDLKSTLYYKHDNLISEYHAFLPEIPPEV